MRTLNPPTVYSLVRLHGSASWPGSILVTKTNHFWIQHDKGLQRFGNILYKNIRTILRKGKVVYIV